MDIRHCPLINIMVTCTEGLYFLGAIDCLRNNEDLEFQYQNLIHVFEEIGSIVQFVIILVVLCRVVTMLVETPYKHIYWSLVCMSWIKQIVTNARDRQMFIVITTFTLGQVRQSRCLEQRKCWKVTPSVKMPNTQSLSYLQFSHWLNMGL